VRRNLLYLEVEIVVDSADDEDERNDDHSRECDRRHFRLSSHKFFQRLGDRTLIRLVVGVQNGRVERIVELLEE